MTPFRGVIGTTPCGGVSPAEDRRDFDMKELERNLRQALDVLEGKCCPDPDCKGKCGQEYNYQALKVIRTGIEQVRRLNGSSMDQNEG